MRAGASARPPVRSSRSRPPKNTTSRSGLSRAIESASSGEYTMRTSAPRAFASSSERRLPPGTRSMSPKLVKITSGRSAIVIASSMRPIGMTQTGQPGPWTSSTSSGKQRVEPVPVDRVRVPAADLHELHVMTGLDERAQLGGDRRHRLRAPVLVDVLHAESSASIASPSSCERRERFLFVEAARARSRRGRGPSRPAAPRA